MVKLVSSVPLGANRYAAPCVRGAVSFLSAPTRTRSVPTAATEVPNWSPAAWGGMGDRIRKPVGTVAIFWSHRAVGRAAVVTALATS